MVNREEVTRKIRVNLTQCVCTDSSAPKSPVSNDNKVFPPPGPGRVPFTGECYDLFQGRRLGVGGGQSELPASAMKKIPQFNIFNKMPYFGVVCPGSHHSSQRELLLRSSWQPVLCL